MLYPIANRVREVQSLDGIWKFRVDRKNAGFSEEWYAYPLKDAVSMAVPASYNDLLTEAEEKEHVGWVWYETVFSVPDSWRGKRIVLRFGSAAHHVVCWLNGKELLRHKGGFLPFEAEISSRLDENTEGECRLTVALSNVLDWTCLPCGEVITKDGPGYPEGYQYQETYFDFYNYAGIHRPVKLYTTPAHYFEDIEIRTELSEDYKEALIKCKVSGTDRVVRARILNEDGAVVAEIKKEAVSTAQAAEGTAQTAEGTERAAEGTAGVAKEAEETARADGAASTSEAEVVFSLKIEHPMLWQPGAAYLYRLCVEGEEDLYTETFGVRSLEVTENAFLINGKPFYFRGFGKHEDSEIHGRGIDLAMNVRDVNLMKWMGANSFRTSHYPYSEEWMMLADREGIAVIDEVPAVGMCFWDSQKVFDGSRVNEETLEHHLQMLRELYARDKNHPCVVMWSVANEAATNEEGAVPYFRKVINQMRSLDQTRPLTMAQTRSARQDLVSQWLDVICLNRYFGWYTDHSHTEVIGLQLEEELKEWHEKYHKPLIMTEYGADTIAGLHRLPAATFSEEFQCEFLDAYHKVFDRLDFVVGEQVWAFADFQTKQGLTRVDGNKKGVFTRDRRPKMAAFLLRKRWTGEEADSLYIQE